MSQQKNVKLFAGADPSRDQGQPLRPINPQEDPLTWAAIASDESVLWECNPMGQIIYTYRDINRETLRHFRIYSTHQILNYWAGHRQDPYNSKNKPPSPIMVIELTKGQRLIWKKRRTLSMALKTTPTIYLAGWQITFNVLTDDGNVVEKSIKAINYLYPTGVVVLADRKEDITIAEWETPTMVEQGDISAIIIEPENRKV